MTTLKQSKFTLGRKVTMWILLISGIFTLFASALQLYLDFKIELKGIEKTLSIIEKSHIKSLENSVWFMDEVNIKTQVEEMLNLPHLAHIRLEPKGMGNIVLGDLPVPEFRVQNSYDLYSEKEVGAEKIKIGRLTVTASLGEVYSTIKAKIIVILISQTVKTFFVSFFILFLIYSLITRHLGKISRYVTDININTKSDQLRIDRNKLGLHLKKPDELDLLVTAINKMQTELQNSLKSLKEGERNYREIFNATSDAVFIHDGKSGRIIDVNEPMLAMYGYKKEEVLGLTPDAFSSSFAPYDQQGVEKKIREAYGKKSHVFEWKARKKNGREDYCSCKGY